MSDIVVPRELTLPLAHGRSVTVWAELNHGQYIAMLSRMYTESKQGELRRDVLKTTDATVIAYLIDWTLTDAQGQRIAVRGLPPNEVQDVLNNLRQAAALEVKQAIEAHHARVEAAGDALKKTDSIDDSSPTPLPSASAAA
jgi:hypothetical protein